MTRIKEVDSNSGKMPDYKSPANRLVHSLRKGYDNVRGKLQEARDKIKYYQIKTRDLEKSRNCHKEEMIKLKKKNLELEAENAHLIKYKEEVEIKKKMTRRRLL
jgi:hypothetical protein